MDNSGGLECPSTSSGQAKLLFALIDGRAMIPENHGSEQARALQFVVDSEGLRELAPPVGETYR